MKHHWWLVCGLLFGLASGVGAEPVLLRYRYQPDTRLITELRTITSGTHETEGQTAQQTRGEFELTFQTKVRQVASDGVAQLELWIDRLELRNALGGDRETHLQVTPEQLWLNDVLVYHSKQRPTDPPPTLIQTVRHPIELHLSPRGQVRGNFGATTSGVDQRELDLQHQMSQEKLVFPETPVAVGQSWEFSTERSLWGGQVKLPSRSRLTFAEWVRPGVARIIYSGSGEASQMQIPVGRGPMPPEGPASGLLDVAKLEHWNTLPAAECRELAYQLQGEILFDTAAGQMLQLVETGLVRADMLVPRTEGDDRVRVRQTQQIEVMLNSRPMQ